MSHLRHSYLQLRRFATSRTFLRPTLGPDYKSKDLWEERFNCDILSSDQYIIKTINTKILSGIKLNNLEVDVFINIAAPRESESAQLCEAVKTLADFRKSYLAHTLLPSTSHAICRLFIDSNRLQSLVKLLEKRIEYGVFPDPFMLNILFDQALERENLVLASRLAALIMLQEEFGVSDLNDNFALYSVSKYIESKTDFVDWTKSTEAPDPILEPENFEQAKADQEESKKADETSQTKDGDEEEEEEEDAEYIRIPFLRNPYNDRHFDLTNPREICGKTLTMLGQHLGNQQALELGSRCVFLGNILLADWSRAKDNLIRCVQSNVSSSPDFKSVVEFYIEQNLNGLVAPDDQTKALIISNLDKLPQGKLNISQEAEVKHAQLKSQEQADIEQLRLDIKQWSELRRATKQAKDAFEARQKLIADIKSKKEELKLREQYLYFYDDLKRKNLTRIEYD